MPNYFSFHCLETDAQATLAAVDQAVCAHFGVAEDPKHYYQYWYGLLGDYIALGKNWAEGDRLLKQVRDEHIYTNDDFDVTVRTDIDCYRTIWNFLWCHYAIRAWYSPGRTR